MPFTPENAKVIHYPGTSKRACEDGYESCEMPASNASNNEARLTGRTFEADNDMTEASD